MIAAPPMRGGAVLTLIVGAVLALSDRSWSQTAPITPPGAVVTTEEWHTTDRSMLDFIEDGIRPDFGHFTIIPDPHLLPHQTWQDRQVSRGRNSKRATPYSTAAIAPNSGAGGNVHATTNTR
jgi:hypothetical protein